MIPRKIFTHWINPNPVVPDLVKKCIETQKIPGYEHHVVTLDNCYRGSKYVNECIKHGRWVKASDWLRIWNIFSEGGIYLDGDMEIMPGRTFDALLENRLFLSKEVGGYWANAALGSEAGHEVLRKYLDRVENNYLGSGDDVFSPGIRCFTDIVWEALHHQEPLGMKECGTDYFFPYNHLTGETLVTGNTIVFHHYMKSWRLPEDRPVQRTEFKLHCGNFHLGDQIFALWFINNAAALWPNYKFSFWVEPRNLEDFKLLASDLPNLEVTSTFDNHSPISWWMGEWATHRRNPYPERFVSSMAELQVLIAKALGISNWTQLPNEALLLNVRDEAKKHPLAGERFDVLFVNSTPLSGQCPGFNQDEMNDIALGMQNKGMMVVTTHPCPGIQPCTTSLGLKLAHIGELATRCRFVVGVVNAPYLATLNTDAFKTVEKWVNYSSDFLNFDDSRFMWARTMEQFRSFLGLPR